MVTRPFCFKTAVLLLGVVLLPAIALSQSVNTDPGIVRLRYVTIVVPDYDQALRWYTNVLGLEKVAEAKFGKEKRWIVVAPRGQKDFGIILEIARPVAPDDFRNFKDSIRNYKDRIGKETRWVFEVEDCRKFYELASRRGVKFVETPVDQVWGVTEAMFEDLYGNVFVVQSPRKE